MTAPAKSPIERHDTHPHLTAKQELYCQLSLTHSYAEAYVLAYDVTNPRAKCHRNAVGALQKHPKITARQQVLRTEQAKAFSITRETLLEFWFARAMYDPAEITAWAVHCCHHCHGAGHGYQWREPDYLDALARAELVKDPLPDIAGGFGYDTNEGPHPACPKCNGRGVGRANIADTRDLSPMARAAFEGVEQTRDGLKIRMADKNRAAEQLAKLAGLDVVQVRHFAASIPETQELNALAGDGLALAALYKTMLGGGSTAH